MATTSIWSIKNNLKNSIDYIINPEKTFNEDFGKFFEKEPNAQDIVQNARELFNKYRSEVFLYQRTKADMPYSTKKVKEQFLPIPYRLFPEDIERRYGISSLDFDFNNIAKIQQRAEREAEKAEKAANAGKK